MKKTSKQLMNKQLFKYLYRQYRIAEKQAKNGDRAILDCFWNILGNIPVHKEILRDVQSCYIKSRHSNDYTYESAYAYFLLSFKGNNNYENNI